MFKAQRRMEEEERRIADEEEARKRSIVENEKARLLAEHAAILKDYHPKASTKYGAFQ